MPDDRVLIFETPDNAIVRAVETALTRAKIAYESPRVRPTLAQMGPKKPPQPFYVAAADEVDAREIVEAAVLRRARVLSLQPKRAATGSGFVDNSGSSIGVFGFDVGGSDVLSGD